MLLTRKEQECSLTTLVSLSFAMTALALFVCSFYQSSHSLAYLQLILTSGVFFLSTSAILKDNDRLLNGLALLITAIPLVFYILIFIVSFISNMAFI